MIRRLYPLAAAILVGTLISAATILFADNPSYVGNDAPEFKANTLVNSAETRMDLKEYAGEWVLLEFWKTTCPPCRRSIDDMAAIQEKYGGKCFTVIGSTNEPPETVLPFLDRHEQGIKINYAISIRPNANWGITGVPHAVIIGPDGKVIWNGHPGNGLMAEVDKAMEARKTAINEMPKAARKPAFYLYEGYFGKALYEAEKGAKKAKDPAGKDACTAIADKVKAICERKLKEVENLVEAKDIYGASEMLKDLALKFKGVDFSKDCAARAKELAKDKELKDYYTASKMFHQINATSRTTDAKKRNAAIKSFETLIEKYAETAPEIADMARKRVEILRSA